MKNPAWLLAAFFVGMLWLLPAAQAAPPALVSVNSCGVSAAGSETEAAVDARDKAAAKILKKMMAPDAHAGSVYQRLLSQSASYAEELRVVSKENKGGKVYLYSQVQVNAQRMHEDMQAMVKALQQNHGDAQTSFVIRVKGISDDAARQKFQSEEAKIFNTTFQNTGFATSSTDELVGLLKAKPQGTFMDFARQYSDRIRQDFPEIGNLVLGEVVITRNETDANGTTVEGSVHLQQIDFLKSGAGRPYSEVQELFTARDTDPGRAMEILCYKVGLNASRMAAMKTLAYWQGNAASAVRS